MTAERIIKEVEDKGFIIFKNDTKPFNLNIICARNPKGRVNHFDDWLYIIWKYQGSWSCFSVPVTADAGLFWLKNPLSNSKGKGTALVAEGQYRGVWKLGKHRGKYDALVQQKEITVIRDKNLDSNLDYDGIKDTGIFGINHHRANENNESSSVNRWSAGCIVTANPDIYRFEIRLFKEASKYWGNSFTFTMLHEHKLF